MKKWVVLILLGIFFLILALVVFLNKSSGEAEGKRFKPSSGSFLENQAAAKNIPGGLVIELIYDNQPLAIYAVVIPDDAKLNLIPNFSEREYGERIAEKYGCQSAVNGGFYQKNNTPLGLFQTEGITYGKQIKSTLVNGFLWQEAGGKRIIEKNPPQNLENLDFLLQSGPYITVGYRLKLVSDERARRMLLGMTKEGKVYFLVVLSKENVFDGPYLADLPLIFQEPEVQNVIPLTSLLNLDGGSASFFLSKKGNEKYTLSELTSIGSLFCLKLLK